MKVAFAGKGGTGKTTLAATLARVAARSGAPVLAVDADSNPNLTLALGLRGSPSHALPPALVTRRLHGVELSRSLAEVVAEFGVPAGDGVDVLTMGAPDHADEGCLCSAHAVVAAVLAADHAARVTVVDLEASPEHLSRGTVRHVDVLLLLTEAYYRSLEAARRLAALAGELPIPRVAVVANKVRQPDEAEAIAEFCARHDLELAAVVPYSDRVRRADLDRVAYAGDAADDPAYAAIGALWASLQPVGGAQKPRGPGGRTAAAPG